MKTIKNIKYYLLIFNMFIQLSLSADLNQMSSSPIQVLSNTNSDPSLVNSVDFHPKKQLFCVTFTHNHSIVIYQLDESDEVTIFQTLQGPLSKLSHPQHALFSIDGESLVVANWTNQTFNIYCTDLNGFYQEEPIAVMPFPSPTESFRPHGMAFSPDGKYLAVAFGASKQDPRAIALYQMDELGTAQVRFKLLSLLQGKEIERGIPKGIAFSPDGSCLLVTLSETNSVILYALDLLNKRIISTPRQILSNVTSQLSRPEDVRFTAEGNYFAVSNSDINTITFYMYDRGNNYIADLSPSSILENPDAKLSFPHGLAFSSDGKYLAVSQFGPVVFDKDSNLSSWGNERRDSVAVYKLK
jgi:WD40 repeat protein